MGSTLDQGSGIKTNSLTPRFQECAIKAIKGNMPEGAEFKIDDLDATHKIISGATLKSGEGSSKVYNGVYIEVRTDDKGELTDSMITSRNDGSSSAKIKDGVITNINAERDVSKPAALETMASRSPDATKEQIQANKGRAIKTLNDIRACMKPSGP
jgi:hypothetical protein